MMNDLYKDIIGNLVKFITLSDIARLLRLSKKTYSLFVHYTKIKSCLIKLRQTDIINDYFFIGMRGQYEYWPYDIKDNKIVYIYNNDFIKSEDNKIIIKSSIFKIFYIKYIYGIFSRQPTIVFNCPNIECIYGRNYVTLLCPMNKLKILAVNGVGNIKYIYDSVKYLELYWNLLSLDTISKHFPNVKKIHIAISFDDVTKCDNLVVFKHVVNATIIFTHIDIDIDPGISRKYSLVDPVIERVKTLFPNIKFIAIDMQLPYSRKFDNILLKYFGAKYRYIFK